MADWTYTLDSIVPNESEIRCFITLCADGASYDTYNFPVDLPETGVDVSSLRGIIDPRVVEILSIVSPIYDSAQAVKESANSMNKAANELGSSFISVQP